MIRPPIEPMLAKLADDLPPGDDFLYEPKWDGFRCLVFRDGDDIYQQSRELKPLNRYFPELLEPLAREIPSRCVLDGEIVIAGSGGLEFESLLLRIHPAASRVKLLASQTPASYVAFDLLALDGEDLVERPLSERREKLERELALELAPLREGALETHPWKEWGGMEDGDQRMPGASSRWNRGKDLSWEALRPERVCEVAYDHLQGDRFRHATHFRRWRPDKDPKSCRYDQLEEVPALELSRIFSAT